MASEYEVCQAKTCDPFDLKKIGRESKASIPTGDS